MAWPWLPVRHRLAFARGSFSARISRRNGDVVLQSPSKPLLLEGAVFVFGTAALLAFSWPGFGAFIGAAVALTIFLLGAFVLLWRRETVRLLTNGAVRLEWRAVVLSDAVILPADACAVYLLKEHGNRWGPLGEWTVLVGRLPDVIAVARLTREAAGLQEAGRVSEALGLNGFIEIGDATPVRALGVWDARTLAEHTDLHPVAREVMEETISLKGRWP